MATTIGANYTHVDISDGTDTTRHYLEDQDARIKAKLQADEIPGTIQFIAFDSSGNVQTITHKDGSNNTVRTDAFTFADNSITEVRTLNTGESLTIATDTTTLTTTVTYAAA